MDNSRVAILEGKSFIHLAVNPYNNPMTYIITFDIQTGTPSFSGIPLVDVYPDFLLATSQIQDKFESKAVLKGLALLGVGYENGITSIYVITETSTTIINQKYKMHSVLKSVIYTIPTGSTSDFSLYPLNHRHYFCEDIEFPIPFLSSSFHLKSEFFWNTAWTNPFSQLGLSNICVNLFQGICDSTIINDFKITFLSRRLSSNYSTTIISRGINSNGISANEIEYELIFEKDSDIYTHIWRSGSFPIDWTPRTKDGKPLPDSDEFYVLSLLSHTNTSSLHYLYLKYQDHETSEKNVSERFFSSTKSTYDIINCNSFSSQTLDSFSNISPSITFSISHNNIQFNNIEQDQINQNCDISQNSIDQTNSSENSKSDSNSNDNSKVDSKQNVLNRFIGFDSSFGVYWYVIKVIGELIKEEFSNEIISKIVAKSSAVSSDLFASQPIFKLIYNNLRWKSSFQDIKLQEKNQIISTFMNPKKPTWSTEIDPLHLFIIPQTSSSTPFTNGIPDNNDIILFPSSILSKNNIDFYQFETSGSCDLCICLSRPMELEEISIWLFPVTFNLAPKSMIIMGGLILTDLTVYGDITLPCPENLKKCTYHIKTDPVRIIRLRFFGNSERFVIGNINFKGRHLIGKYKTLPYIESAQSETNIKEYEESFKKFLGSNRHTIDALQLAMDEIRLGLDDSIRVKYAKNSEINPWICDSAGLLLNCPRFNCALCGETLQSGYIQFEPSPLIPSLITKVDSTINNPNRKILNVCSKCKEIAEKVSDFTQKVEVNMIP